MWWSEPHPGRPRALGPLVACALACIAGCGFRPSGIVEFPQDVQLVHVETANRYSPFYRELTAALRADGRRLTADPDEADTVIDIRRDETGQRVLAVSARNVPREYDIYYIVRYAVRRDGIEVMAPQTLTLNRDYTFDETRILGKAREEDALRQWLAAELVRLVTREMAALDGG